ncbi:hypothetical protein F5Y14DRAFT_445774 [Nemania sp. NC0429]|nr:hypothetical protein F5Y14DRAFT_445774 [Nemania sp. NC0429]
MILSIIGICLRSFLLLIGGVVLALSITLTKHQESGQAPSETGFAAFTGAAGLLTSGLGMVALWYERISGSLIVALDGIVSSFYLAGAIAFTIAMKSVLSCTATDNASVYSRATNSILNGGCDDSYDKLQECPFAFTEDGKDLTPGRCQVAQADYVFEYAGFVFGVCMIFMSYLINRRGRGGTPLPSRAYH